MGHRQTRARGASTPGGLAPGPGGPGGRRACRSNVVVGRQRVGRSGAEAPSLGNDPSAGSPTETLLRLLLPLNDQV